MITSSVTNVSPTTRQDTAVEATVEICGTPNLEAFRQANDPVSFVAPVACP